MTNKELASLMVENNFISRIEELERKIEQISRRPTEVGLLSDITDDMGDLRAGRFLALTNEGEPTDADGCGVVMDADGEEFDSVNYNLYGVNNGTLQFGGSASDGTLTAGAGAVTLDANGIGITQGTAGGKPGQFAPNGITFYESDDDPAGDVYNFANASTGFNETVVRATESSSNQGIVRLQVLNTAGAEQAGIYVADDDTTTGINLNAEDITIGTSTADLNTNGNIYDGLYTPTITSVTNIDATTAYNCMYFRIGDLVHVAGQVSIDVTTGGGTASQIGISLPIASTFTGLLDCSGTAALDRNTESARIDANSTYNRAKMQWGAVSTGNVRWAFEFTYKIL